MVGRSVLLAVQESVEKSSNVILEMKERFASEKIGNLLLFVGCVSSLDTIAVSISEKPLQQINGRFLFSTVTPTKYL